MGYAGPNPTKPNTKGGAVITSGRVPTVVKPVGTVTKPVTTKTKKEKLQAELAQSEMKLRWLTDHLVPFYAMNNHHDVLFTPPFTKYRETRYLIKVDGKDKNSLFKFFEKRMEWVDTPAVYNPFVVKNVHSLENINKLKVELKRQIATLKNDIAALSQTKPTPIKKSAIPKPKTTTPPPPKKGALIYNVSAVKDAYFSTQHREPNFTLLDKDGNQTQGGIVNPYLDLWKNATNHKGMISSWVNNTSTGTVSTKNMAGSSNFKQDNNRYAFQFQYNPQPITMSYAGAPPVDIANFTSGQEEYALYTGGSGSGNITFDLVINRIDDLKYYSAPGVLISEAYPGRQPYGAKDTAKVKALFNEQEFIYNKGTMYDVEYLLRTVMGVTMESKFRGKTADFGWIGAMPIELHLSPGLRYWATLSSFTINHVLFSERMVPIFSTVKISCNRLPDYVTPGVKLDAGQLVTSGMTNLTNPWDKKKALG